MRDIKFRIWNTETMYNYGDYVNEEGCDCHVVGICNGQVLIEERCKDDGNYGQIRISRMDELTIMQYTGLKDKNGVEIYEGDIVEIQHPCWSAICETKFFDGAFWFIENNNPINNSQIRADKYLKQGWVIEVIGNIFENPELLK